MNNKDSEVMKTQWLKYSIHCVPKNIPPCDCLYLHQILTDFQNSLNVALCGQLATKWLLNITPHVNCVTTLPCKIKMPEKITITDSKCLVNKIHFQPKMHDVRCYTLLYPFLWPIVIWRIELYVCFWPLLFSKPTISSTMITFSSVRVCFSLPISCRWLIFPKSVLIKFPLFPCCSSSSKILLLFSKNCIFGTGTSS